jgi:PAS domain S-box-containing protein
VLVIVTFSFYVYSEKQIDVANEQRLQSFLLAHELRQSSDDLTRMVRSYIVTSNPANKQHYLEILDIRDGRKPRPVNYQNVYWDLVKKDSRPSVDGQEIALLDLIQQANFTDAEFAKLLEAKAKSDALTNAEFTAMALVESTNPPTDSNRHKAFDLVFGEAYLEAKASIMRPIGELWDMMNKRTSEKVRFAANMARAVRAILCILGLLMMFTLWRAYRALYETLGCSIAELQQHISILGSGDFSSAISVNNNMKNSVLGWLSETQVNLQWIDNERKKAEEATQSAYRYARSLIEASLDPLVTISLEGKITDVNTMTEQVTGIPRELLIGSDFADYFTDPEAARAGYQSVFLRGIVIDYPLAIRNIVGDVIDVLYNASVYRNHHGDIVGVFAAARDITVRKKAEEALRVAKENAEVTLTQLKLAQNDLIQSEKMAALGGLVAGISHEINTPIGLMLSSVTHFDAKTNDIAKLYENGELDEITLDAYFNLVHRITKIITANCQRAADLISSFKQVAVDQSSGHSREFEIKHYIKDVLLSLHPVLKNTPIQVELDCPEGLIINSYAGAIAQILTNFIMNSLKHGYESNQKGILLIRIRLLDDDMIELIYADNGKGIPNEIQSKVFDPFFTTQRGNGGTGLGLHIVYNLIIYTLNGSLELQSSESGTTFLVKFPRISPKL